jgi:hypothetical protein
LLALNADATGIASATDLSIQAEFATTTAAVTIKDKFGSGQTIEFVSV